MELLHTAFGSTVTLLLTLVGFKYQGSATTLFREHSFVISLFIIDILVYIIAFVNVVAIRSTSTSSSTTTSSSENSNTILTYKHIFLTSGAVGCELLLFILVTLVRWFVINMFVLLIFEVLRRWHRQIKELLLTVTSSLFVPAINYLIHSMFQPLYSNGFWMLTILCVWGQEIFATYPLFTREIRAEQDREVGTICNYIFCNNIVFHSALCGEDSWFLRIYNSGLSFSSEAGRANMEHEAAGGDVQMIHMV